MKTKLTTCEKRALAYCERLKANDGGTVAFDWKRSAMYGMNPVPAVHPCFIQTDKTPHPNQMKTETVTPQPYTPQQVIHNLEEMLRQLRNVPQSTDGPGWCVRQCRSIIARGIEGDKLHTP